MSLRGPWRTLDALLADVRRARCGEWGVEVGVDCRAVPLWRRRVVSNLIDLTEDKVPDTLLNECPWLYVVAGEEKGSSMCCWSNMEPIIPPLLMGVGCVAGAISPPRVGGVQGRSGLRSCHQRNRIAADFAGEAENG